jgi:hypothetical protein
MDCGPPQPRYLGPPTAKPKEPAYFIFGFQGSTSRNSLGADYRYAENLVHHYFGIDVVAVWSAVERDLPNPKRTIMAILAEG